MKAFSQKINKPWGYELLITPPESPTTGKLAFTKAGQRWSLQYHDKKDETICLISGKASLIHQGQSLRMKTMQGYRIKPGEQHRLVAETDCLSLEVSTPEKGSVTVRLEDDYGRGNETDAVRKKIRS
ncbi:MAG: cupin [Patescibacteria group bacterium]